jgi:hypothetical protein
MGASGAFSAVLNDLTNLPQAVTDAQAARDAAETAQTAAEAAAAAAAASNPGAPNGTAQLDASSKLLETQVPDRLADAVLSDSYGFFVSVKQFGAIGDSVADDTAAIQAAIDAVAGAGGGTVFFPLGVYRMDPIKLKTKVRLQGAGWGSELRRWGPLRTAGPFISLDSPEVYQTQIADLAVNGSNVGSISTEDAIVLDGGALSNWGGFSDPSHVIENVLIHGAAGKGIYLKGFARETVLSHIYIRNVGHMGVYVESGCSDCKFFDVKVNAAGNAGASGPGYHGFYFASNVSAVQCKAYFCGSTANPASGFSIHTGNRSVLVGCEGQDNGGDGVTVTNADGVVITNFVAAGNDNTGLLANNATNLIATGFQTRAPGTRAGYDQSVPASFQNGSTGVFEGSGSGGGAVGGNALGSMHRIEFNNTGSPAWNHRSRREILSTKAANYTLVIGDEHVIFNGATLTATLPDPTTTGMSGRRFTVKNINAGALTVVSAGTSKTIDGAASASLPQWGKGTYVSDGAQWLSI